MEAEVDGVWKLVYLGKPINLVSQLIPCKTPRVRIRLNATASNRAELNSLHFLSLEAPISSHSLPPLLKIEVIRSKDGVVFLRKSASISASDERET